MPGCRVWVPFGKKERLGIVLGNKESTEFKTKPISQIIDAEPVLSTELLAQCEWISRYYQSPLSQVLKLALPKSYRDGKPQLIMEPPTSQDMGSATKHIILNPEQAEAANTIKNNLDKFNCFLLQGITGSGKTEVYINVIATVLQQGKQALYLVPEIGLTPELIIRLQTQLSVEIVAIHSKLNDTERTLAFEKARRGIARLVVGTRTAIFTPMDELGLMVIDEEHDLSFKQMDNVRYSARDTALMRAHRAQIPIILGSATPSLESLYNVSIGKYQSLRLTTRALNAQLPMIELVDLRNQTLQEGLAGSTIAKIKSHLEKNLQILVFINRRGFAPILLCHSCGFIADCKHCDTHLTYHRGANKLICHHCGWSMPTASLCQACGANQLLPIGIGTERILAGLESLFPEVNKLKIDRDEIRSKKAFEKCLAQIQSGEAQLLVGTQMLAKGHNFPKLSLVVVLDIDAGLSHYDFRSLERLGQLLTQVAGRAGRAQFAGEVLIQTYQPSHAYLNCLIQHGYDVFMEHIMQLRKMAELPPFAYLIMLQAESKKVPTVMFFMQWAKNILQRHDLILLGPAPSGLARKAGFHRMQLLLKANQRSKLQLALQDLRTRIQEEKVDKGLRWYVDVDPLTIS